LALAFDLDSQAPRRHGHRGTGCGLITTKKLPLKCSDWQYSHIATHIRKKLHFPAQSGAPGGDLFRGGASNIQLYQASGETQVYASFFDYGSSAVRRPKTATQLSTKSSCQRGRDRRAVVIRANGVLGRTQ